MKITKLAHCCLLLETNGRKILLDPGSYSIEKHASLTDIDIVLVTHEHFDHFHIPSLKAMVESAPDLAVITNDAVGELVAKEGIVHTVMRNGDSRIVKDIKIEAFGKDHALMHSSIPPVSNIGYFIDDQFFFPGDALTDPKRKVDVLALPVAGPWLKISEAIDYGLALKPRIAFPVHDGLRLPSQHLIPEKVLGAKGIQFIKLEEGGEIEI